MKDGYKIALAAAGLLFAVPVGLSLIGGAASVASAPGRVVSKTMQTDNIIGSYESFFNRKAAFDARVAQIDEHVGLMKENTDPAETSRLRIELAGMRQSCRELATTYNADAAKMNKSLFRDGKLPATLSETDCNA